MGKGGRRRRERRGEEGGKERKRGRERFPSLLDSISLSVVLSQVHW